MPYTVNAFTGELDYYEAAAAALAGYALLAGRTGTTNDLILSLDDSGSLYGTTLTGAGGLFKGLHLNAKQDSTLGPMSVNALNANATTVLGPNILLAFGLSPMTFDDDATYGPSSILGISVGGAWTVGDDSMGGPGGVLFSFDPTITNPAGVAKHLSSGVVVLNNQPHYIADGAACDLSGTTVFQSFPIFETSGGGTVSVPDFGHMDIAITADAGCSFGNTYGIAYEGFRGAGSVVNDTAIVISDGDVIASNNHLSLSSSGPMRQMQHRGPAVFGASQSPATNSVGLELASTTLAVLPSRMTTTERDALTATNGMVLYNSSTDKLQVRAGGSWVDLH